jgi:heme/copper-type cytochrome/quinol oxidase subunit 3
MPAEPTPPRTRGAAIVWGLLFAAIAAFGIWTLTDDGRRESTADWITTLTPNTVYSLVLLTIGVLVLVGGAVGLIRHAQRRAAPQR